jgi:hypothetical protein
MASQPVELYLDLMSVIRNRLDIVDRLASTTGRDYARGESAAFHGRKVIEGIAFGCLVATEHGLKHIPRDAKGQWNAESILKSLSSKGLSIFPSPCVIRAPSDDERARHNVKSVVEGVPERRLSVQALIEMYQRMHRWLHELNPYVSRDQSSFYAQHGHELWNDLSAINRFVEKHFISISGEGFVCVLRDNIDGQTKVLPLSKVEELDASGA